MQVWKNFSSLLNPSRASTMHTTGGTESCYTTLEPHCRPIWLTSSNLTAMSKARFSSPDRFLPLRAECVERESVFRASKSPHHLSPCEQLQRQRDHNADPFHCTSPLRSADAISVRHSSLGGRQPPHFTPSFVHGQDASTGLVDANESPIVPRQTSVGAVWNMGGPFVAQGGPRPGVHDGHGGLLASGTNGPLHTADFLDRNSSSQDVQQHEHRLALALDIDQASRVLESIPRPLKQSDSIGSSQRRPYAWRNNSWTRDEGPDRKLFSPPPESSHADSVQMVRQKAANVSCDLFQPSRSESSMLRDYVMIFTARHLPTPTLVAR